MKGDDSEEHCRWRIVLDSAAFDLLVGLTSKERDVLLAHCEFFTTDVNLLELSRAPASEKKTAIEHFLECNLQGVLPAKIFRFGSGPGAVLEDSTCGFSDYNKPTPGGMLSYEDADLLKHVKPAQNKLGKGRALNDFAISLAFIKQPNAVFVTEDKKLAKALVGLGRRVMLFAAFRNWIVTSDGGQT